MSARTSVGYVGNRKSVWFLLERRIKTAEGAVTERRNKKTGCAVWLAPERHLAKVKRDGWFPLERRRQSKAERVV
ncbi:hypothetical protein GN244_ATG04466 [Phytophthora infestans]|uniref:Uncharacterized protein n=1 Tax=Phytophthora infestans TaxID=4787 RepID=A0A833TMH2_PHYIN|nr:hypothetical protein GN244_ATG04466 [Phytophthora infestans]